MSTIDSSTATPVNPQSALAQSRALVWLKRIALGLAIGLVALVVIGAIYQAIATEIDKRNYPAPGQLVDVGGYSLHLYCVGENTDGRPTVILEPGLGATSSAWAWIQPTVAKTTRVCAYDRAGMGWSDPSPARATHNTSPPSCIRCLRTRKSPDLTFWPVGHTAVCISAPMPTSIVTKLRV